MPEQASQPIHIGPDANFITVSAEGHTWVSVWADGTELSRESGGGAVTSFHVEPGRYTVRTDGTLTELAATMVQLPPLPSLFADTAPARVPTGLRLESDAQQRHPADGVAELPADGESFVTVTVEGPPGEIFLRTTGGALLDAKGEQRVRSVRLDGGKARVRLVSSQAPGLVTVHAFGRSPLLRAELPVEFV